MLANSNTLFLTLLDSLKLFSNFNRVYLFNFFVLSNVFSLSFNISFLIFSIFNKYSSKSFSFSKKDLTDAKFWIRIEPNLSEKFSNFSSIFISNCLNFNSTKDWNVGSNVWLKTFTVSLNSSIFFLFCLNSSSIVRISLFMLENSSLSFKRYSFKLLNLHIGPTMPGIIKLLVIILSYLNPILLISFWQFWICSICKFKSFFISMVVWFILDKISFFSSKKFNFWIKPFLSIS